MKFRIDVYKRQAYSRAQNGDYHFYKLTKRLTGGSLPRVEIADLREAVSYTHLAPMLTEMAKLSKVLRQKRKERGAVDFDFPESKICLLYTSRCV